MSYRQITCPVCGRDDVEAEIKRDDPALYVGLHTRAGRACAGMGQKVETNGRS